MKNSQITKIKKELKSYSTKERAEVNAWFFKTGKEQYGEGDKFIGVTVPDIRKVSKKYNELKLNKIEALLKSKIHEERLCAVFILTNIYKEGDEETKKSIYNFYLSHTKYINNWDIVDSSAPYIVGDYLYNKDKKILLKLANSSNLWERRIAIVSTLYFIAKGEYEWTFRITEILIKDKHDLIHKACGWMLREVGKKTDENILCSFLDNYAVYMPRTMLRYSIERFSTNKRKAYMALK